MESDSESSDSDSEEEEHSNVGLDLQKVVEKNPIYNAWDSIKDGAPDGHYERIITP